MGELLTISKQTSLLVKRYSQ